MPESSHEAENLLSHCYCNTADGEQTALRRTGGGMSGSSRVGVFRAYWLGVVVCMGGFVSFSQFSADLREVAHAFRPSFLDTIAAS